MRLTPRLLHKLLLLVAVPLAFELLFAGTLLSLLKSAETAGDREHRAREAVASLNSIYERIMDASKVAGFLLFGSGKTPQFEKFHDVTATIPSDLDNIREQLRDDADASQKVDKLDRDLNATLRIMDEVFDQMQSGDRMGAVQHLRDVKTALVDLSDQLITLRESCNKEADEDYDQQRASRHRIYTVIESGILINVIIALMLWLYTHRNITSRLAVVIANTHRLAADKPLLPSVTGSDEIQHLDKVFKDMVVALEMAREKERAIIETMPAGLLIVDGRGGIQMSNPTLLKMLGYVSGGLDFKHVSSLFVKEKDEDDASCFSNLIEKANRRATERIAQGADGKPLPVELSLTPFRVFDNEYFLLVLLDVTERKEIERLKQEFVSMVSHDLRTPLTSIQVFLEMLAKGMMGQVSELIQKKATMADRNATRLIGLINDLLDIDKMESGQLELACDDISLSTVIERSLDSVKGFADKQGIKLVGTETDLTVHADPDRLVQVMVNLLGNAIKFSPKEGVVSIILEKKDDFAVLKVCDQGRGVPEKMRTQIFERFKQVETKDATEKKGTGLGLAICKAIVEQHGGSIGLDSVEGSGSTFWFTVPLKTVPTAVPAAELTAH